MVQVYGSERPCGWVKRCCGVACLVKDNPQRSYYIRVLDMKVRAQNQNSSGSGCEEALTGVSAGGSHHV